MTLFQRLLPKGTKVSYSQCGEDLILEHLFEALKIPRPSYLDIGAHDPVFLSNTFLFYTRGSRGVCVEPNPVLFERIRRKRRMDVCLNVGIGTSTEGKVPFYVMTTPTLSTFSREEADRYQGYGAEKIEKILDIPLVSVNEVVKDYFHPCPDFVSLDVEGLDLAILGAFDFARYRPAVFCVETLTYTEDRTERKIDAILEIMNAKGYMAYADTYINTIFVERESWRNRPTTTRELA